MSALHTEPLTAEEMVRIAREQVDAVNFGDWERMRAGLAANARYELTWNGTHTGPLEAAGRTTPASDKRHHETPPAIFFTFEGGKIKRAASTLSR